MDQQKKWSEKFCALTDESGWFKNFAHGLLDETDINPHCKQIFLFTFLWMIFEQRILNEYAGNSKSERKKMLNLRKKLENCKKCKVDPEQFHAEFTYFRDRYFDRGNRTYHFDKLFPKNEDRAKNDRKYVLKILGCEEEPKPQNIVPILLTILYRYRNRLFHGEKWSEGLDDQFENFDNANSVLIKAIKIQIYRNLN